MIGPDSHETRIMIDAIRDVLGLKPLYGADPEPKQWRATGLAGPRTFWRMCNERKANV